MRFEDAEFIPVSRWDFHFLTILRYPGERAILPRPGERAILPREDASPRPPLAESVFGARSSAGATEGCGVGMAWRHREAPGGRVELGTRSRF